MAGPSPAHTPRAMQPHGAPTPKEPCTHTLANVRPLQADDCKPCRLKRGNSRIPLDLREKLTFGSGKVTTFITHPSHAALKLAAPPRDYPQVRHNGITNSNSAKKAAGWSRRPALWRGQGVDSRAVLNQPMLCATRSLNSAARIFPLAAASISDLRALSVSRTGEPVSSGPEMVTIT